jgi:predicted hydrocarbon binding protein
MSEQVNFSINFSSDPKVLKETEDRIKGISQATAGAEKSIQHYFDVTKENITIQKQVVAELEKQLKDIGQAIENAAPGKLKGDLMQERASIASELNAEKNALVQLEAEVKKTEVSHDTLRTALRKLQEEMARMEMAGKRNTDEYRALQLEAGRVADAIGDVKKQSRILANDERMFQGVIEGVGGIAGAFSAAQGAVGLFAGENENLQKIMTRVQSLMAITIGLQQIAQVVNKDSAFRVVVLTRAKEIWAATNIKVATTLGITTGAASVLMATLTLGLSVAITAIIAGLSIFISKQGEAKKEMQEFNKAVAESAAKPVASIMKLSTEWKKLGDNINAKSQFISEHRKEFDKLGVTIKSVAEAENLLVKNTEAFVNAQIARVKAEAMRSIAGDKIQKALTKELELEKIPEKVVGNVIVGQTQVGDEIVTQWERKVVDNQKYLNVKKEVDTLNKEIANMFTKAATFDKLADGIMSKLNTGTTKGIIDELEQQIKDLEEKKKGATSEAEISKYNSEIKNLKDKLKQYDLPSDQSSSKAISDFKSIVKTKLEEIQFINDRIKFLQDEQSKISPKDKNSKEKGTVINDLLTEELKRAKQITSDILNQYKIFLGQRIDFSTDYYNSISAIDAQIESTTDEAKKKELLQMKETYKALYDLGINGFDALKQLNDGSIADFGTFEEKKLQIVQKYEKQISAARFAGNESLVKGLEKGRDQEITQLLEDTVKSADAIAKLFTGIDQLGDKAKSSMIKNLKYLIDWVDQNKNNPNAEWTGTFYIDPKVIEQLKATPELIDKLRESYREFIVETDKPAFKKLTDAIDELQKARKENNIQGAADASAKIAENIGGATLELISATDLFAGLMDAFGADSNITQFVSQATSAYATISKSGMDSIEGVSSLIGLAIWAIGYLWETSINEGNKALAGLEADMTMLENSSSNLKELWSSTSFKPQNVLMPKELYGQTIFVDVEFRTKEEAFDAYKQNLNDQIEAIQKQREAYLDSLLFEDNADPEVLAALAAKITELTGELYNADEAFAETFGEWGTVIDQVGDSIFEAFANGTDAGIAWGDAMKKVFRSMIKDAFTTSIVAQYLQPVIDYMNYAIADTGGDALLDENYINYFMSLIQGAYDGMEEVLPYWQGFFDKLGIFDTTAANGLQTAIKTITSEEAGIIAGNLNAYRITGYEIKELITEALLYLSKIETNTSYIKKIYDKINSTGTNNRSQGLLL